MKLVFLNIKFQLPEDFLKSIDSSLNSTDSTDSTDSTHSAKSTPGKIQKVSMNVARTLNFDSEKTFNNIFTLNKLQILRAVSQQNPESIYGLASYLGREPQHVLKDCRLLESLKFLILEESSLKGRSTLTPKLAFNYDVIKVYAKSSIQPFTVSKKAEDLLWEKTGNALEVAR